MNFIFQSACGYDTNIRRDREKRKNGEPLPTKESERRTPFDFMGCLAHVEITERARNGEVSRIAAYLSNNHGCRSALLKHLQAVPLHDRVYEMAFGLLENGAR